MRHLLIAIALLALAPAASLAAGTHGFQLEVDAMGATPTGTYESGTRARELINMGGAVFGKALIGLNRTVYLGFGGGYLRNQKDANALIGTDPQATLAAHRSLEAIPLFAMAQLRSDTHRKLSWYGEGGLGMTTFTLRYQDVSLQLPSLEIPIAPTADFQKSISYLLGGGACLGLGRDFDLIAGVDYYQSFPGSGDVWHTGDNPAYVLYSLGLRYPRW